MRFRHRPTEVEAIQWFKPGDHPDECRCGTGNPNVAPHLVDDLMLPGLGGADAHLNPGDFILTHADGCHEVLTPAELAEDYEPVPISHGVVYHHVH